MLVRNLYSAQIDIPNEPGQWMKFRWLNSRRIAECVEQRQIDALERMKALGSDGLALIREAAASNKDKENNPVVVADPVDSFDQELLLKYGIAEWSYAAKDIAAELSSDDGGLDPKTAKWAVREILKLNGLLPAERETDLGN